MLAASMMINEDDDNKRGWRDDYEDGNNTCFTPLESGKHYAKIEDQ